jgi:hypothetical protein
MEVGHLNLLTEGNQRKEVKMEKQNSAESEKPWVDVDPFERKTYPPIYRRCLFERKDGFRFYGYFEHSGDVVPYTPRTPRFKLIHIRRFRIEEDSHGRRR